MKKILVTGPKDPPGGVERVCLEYIRRMQTDAALRFDILITGEGFSLAPDFEACGCRILYLPPRRQDPAAYRKGLAGIIKDGGYDAVWANVSGLTNVDVLREAKKHGVKTRIVHSHVAALSWSGALMRVLVPLLHGKNKRKIDRLATDFWACSETAGRFMFPARVQDRLVVRRNAVDTAAFSPDEETRAGTRAALGLTDAFTVGHVARLCREKNQPFLLEVFAAVREQDPSARLLLVGDGEARQALEAQIEALSLSDAVIMTGARTDVAALLNAMDVFVFPSFKEGLGLSVIEAEAVGLPCVVSDGVPRDVNLTGNVSFLSLADSPARWAAEILEKKNARMTGTADALKRAGYDLDAAAAELRTFFEDLP